MYKDNNNIIKDMDLIIESFDQSNNRWILNVDNTDEGIKELIALAKSALKLNKKNREQNRLSLKYQPINDFITYCCDINEKGLVLADDLRRAYCAFCNVESNEVTKIRFGTMMSDFINGEMNYHSISRKAVRTGTAYAHLSLKRIVSVNTAISPPVPTIPTPKFTPSVVPPTVPTIPMIPMMLNINRPVVPVFKPK